MSALPEEAFAATLAGLDRMTIGRLAVLLDGRPPSVTMAMIVGEAAPAGMVAHLFDTPGLLTAWRDCLRRRPVEQVWEACLRHGMSVLVRGSAGYPPSLVDDPEPAPVLFVRGSLDGLTGRRVGMVGTRNATGSGRDMATSMGAALASEGVHVVSGLARGIDGCAHRGVLSVDGAAPIAVVASGLDVVYPREHAGLWAAVAERGALLSEAPPGTQPEPYRFPLRNRIIAGLSEVLVVVESRETGGSLITAVQANARSTTVMAVPGAVRNRAARGTNDLIRDGALVATDVGDVLMALGLDHRRNGRSAYDPRPRPQPEDREVLAMCCEPRTLDQLGLLTGRTLAECAMSVARLELHGWVQQVNGWFEAAGGPTGRK
ncbi:MAG: dprA [Ilumatobacteraceae bacterium]|nr:dprA [Ilumatobacteraceae bacterium]